MSMSMVQIRDAVRAEIAGQMREIADRLAAGRASDFPMYKQMVGRIQGGSEAMEAVDRVFRKFLEEDE